LGRSSVHEHAHSKVLTPDGIDRSLRRISHEILERNASNLEILALVGVLTRGVPLAHRISENIRLFEGLDVPVGSLDITLHRDDLAGEEPEVRGSRVPFEISGRTVVLVDDVLYTGRTARAAMDAGSCRSGRITWGRTSRRRAGSGCS
jgi:pyrimidine operon attenuation protein/uracil phosphoribosyltransferase